MQTYPINCGLADRSAEYVKFDAPSTCPICGNSMEPQYVYSRTGNTEFLSNSNGRNLYCSPFLMRCTHRDCKRYFLLNVLLVRYGNKITFQGFAANNYAENVKINFPDTIKDVSPNFVTIYEQALKAEKWELDKLTGMGYRRALEYLVKDYLATTKLNKTKDEIYQMSFTSAIQKIDSQEIKDLAKASSWLGNDETHTFKKWEDYDIENLKNFINSIVSYISFKIQTKKAQSLLDSK